MPTPRRYVPLPASVENRARAALVEKDGRLYRIVDRSADAVTARDIDLADAEPVRIALADAERLWAPAPQDGLYRGPDGRFWATLDHHGLMHRCRYTFGADGRDYTDCESTPLDRSVPIGTLYDDCRAGEYELLWRNIPPFNHNIHD